MEGMWNTVATILATGIVIYGGYFLRDFLQGKRETERQKLEKEREIRDAKRKYRERMVTPVKEALTKLYAKLRSQSLADGMYKDAREKGISLEPEIIKGIELLKEQIERSEGKAMWEAGVEFVSLAAAITNEDVREHVEKAFLHFGMGKQIREVLNITDQDMKEIFNLAFQKLEDYVALAG